MRAVAALSLPGVLNLYDEEQSQRWGDPPGEATRRRHALRGYLESHWSAPTVLVGEAPGTNGARRTGLPFTSMRQLTGEGPAEATATAVRRALAQLGQEEHVLLWNASVLYAPGNRDPRREEIAACAPVLDLVCRGRKVLAIGRHAQRATGAPYIRHPSHGGGPQFATGLREALSGGLSPVGGPDADRLDRPDPDRPDSAGSDPASPDRVAHPAVSWAQPVGTLDTIMRPSRTRVPRPAASAPDRRIPRRG